MIVVGVLLSPLLVGIQPVGGDPDVMYKPFKEELAHGLRDGRLPFWSDRFGLGLPLVAESHVSAFYPLNWLFYWAFDVSTAYRFLMWLHYVALAGVTYGYARVLSIDRWGSALTALGFSLCGFQAVHAVHEPFYHLMPFLPLCLLLADRYMATGRLAWLAGLALAWGLQITLGHFQIQMWTACLALVIGRWRVSQFGLPRWRWLGLIAGLSWGTAVAGAQLCLTWELTQVAGFDRASDQLARYLFPWAHWAQWALPPVYLGRQPIGSDPYWTGLKTTSMEACAYVGVVPLILACIGLLGARRDRWLTPWLWIASLAFALATMPQWWPYGYFLLLQVPGIGWFRAPARYTLLTSLGLVLWAGRGLDRSIAPRLFWNGLALAVGFGLAALVWSVYWSRDPVFQASLGIPTLGRRFAATAVAWVLGLGAIVAWRLGRIGAWGPLAVATAELCGLFFLGPIPWGRSVRLPEQSPILQRLLAEPRVGLVAGGLMNIPASVGLCPACPAVGIAAPPPNNLLVPALLPPRKVVPNDWRWQRRFGVTHGVWAEDDDVRGTEITVESPDPAFERLMWNSPTLPRSGRWKLVRYPDPFPTAWVSIRAHQVSDSRHLYAALLLQDRPDDAWFVEEEGPLEAGVPSKPSRANPSWPRPDTPDPGDIMIGIAARTARVRSWDGRTAIVEHDGTCYLTLRRAHYPGWSCRVNGGPEQPVFRINGGLQGVLLALTGPEMGTGTRMSRVELTYRPTRLAVAAAVSLAATAATLFTLAMAGLTKALRWRRSWK